MDSENPVAVWEGGRYFTKWPDLASHELIIPMKSNLEEHSELALKIAIVDEKLTLLENEIREIGQPAGHELLQRSEVLRIEEKALKRNFEESRQRGEPDSVRLEKIEKLLNHIEREESSMEADAHFLHQAAPTSVGLAVDGIARMVELYRRAFRRRSETITRSDPRSS
jgi:hypothetical protein